MFRPMFVYAFKGSATFDYSAKIWLELLAAAVMSGLAHSFCNKTFYFRSPRPSFRKRTDKKWEIWQSLCHLAKKSENWLHKLKHGKRMIRRNRKITVHNIINAPQMFSRPQSCAVLWRYTVCHSFSVAVPRIWNEATCPLVLLLNVFCKLLTSFLSAEAFTGIPTI